MGAARVLHGVIVQWIGWGNCLTRSIVYTARISLSGRGACSAQVKHTATAELRTFSLQPSKSPCRNWKLCWRQLPQEQSTQGVAGRGRLSDTHPATPGLRGAETATGLSAGLYRPPRAHELLRSLPLPSSSSFCIRGAALQPLSCASIRDARSQPTEQGCRQLVGPPRQTNSPPSPLHPPSSVHPHPP